MEELGENSWVCTLKDRMVGFIPHSFDEMWDLRPKERTQMEMFGKTVETPRWHRNYGKDYKFRGMTEAAQEDIPPCFKKFLTCCQHQISPRLNTILVNWYCPDDYIGMHSDNEKGLDLNQTVITYTLCPTDEKRKFVLQNKDTGEKREYWLGNGDIFVMGGECQSTHKHGLPRSTKYKERRISITVRAAF